MLRWLWYVVQANLRLERSLIVERVKAGLRNARAKGKRLGRPKRSWTAQDRPASRTGRILAQNCETDGVFGQDGAQGGAKSHL